MKKTIVLLACIFGISIVVSGQEREKKVLELKNGTTVTGFVMEQSDGNYMLETETGDILFYAKDEVRTVLDKEKKDADRERGMNYQGSDRLVKSGFSLTFSNSRLDLQPNQVSGRFWDEYTSAARKKKSGMVMMIIGGAVAGVGSTVGTLLSSNDNQVGLITTIASGGVGLGLATFGLIGLLSGNSKLNRLATQYNNGQGYASELSFDFNPAGFALVYSF